METTGNAVTGRQTEAERWVELRDAKGKLQAKYDPVGRVLEIQRRGVRTQYALETVGDGDRDEDYSKP